MARPSLRARRKIVFWPLALEPCASGRPPPRGNPVGSRGAVPEPVLRRVTVTLEKRTNRSGG